MSDTAKKKKKGNLDNLEEYISDPPIETEENGEAGAAGGEELAALRAEIETLKKAVAEQEEKHLRVLAEYDNFRKRSTKERERAYTIVVAETIESFLPVADNLERASESPECDEGIKMICKQFFEVMGRHNVRPYGEAGEQFDPNLHNAVVHEEDPEAEENVITEVMQKGYMLGERMIRPAMVKTVN